MLICIMIINTCCLLILKFGPYILKKLNISLPHGITELEIQFFRGFQITLQRQGYFLLGRLRIAPAMDFYPLIRFKILNNAQKNG